MRCPYCRHLETDVIDTRDTDDYRIRRRRECAKCGRRFTTYEATEMGDLYVLKKDGRREKFERRKLLAGLERACEKRPVTGAQVEEIANWVESRLRKMEGNDVKSSQIGEIVMERLQKVDDVSYIRFASVYRSFADVDSFEKALKTLRKKK